MAKSRKRKHAGEGGPQSAEISTTHDPYPTHERPTPDECNAIRDDLLALHGFPPEFLKYRLRRRLSSTCNSHSGAESEPLIDDASGDGDADADDGHGGDESVLDGLVKTLLSQNTTELNSLRAFASLKSAFPTWEEVLAAESKSIEIAIKCGGLAPTKTSCIKNLLSCLLERKGKLCLEYLRELQVEEIKAELSHFKGIGPKTVACVLMFNLQIDDFPVDTHVFEISKAVGWVPAGADRQKTYLHLNRRIPEELKFDLNCLLYSHGKQCRKCGKKGNNKVKNRSNDVMCPLLKYCNGYGMKITDQRNQCTSV